MTQVGLFLLLVAATGIYAVRWTARLAPLGSELPIKTLFATLLSGLVVVAEFAGLTVSPTLLLTTLILGPLFVFAPLAVTGLARVARFGLALLITQALYWTAEGRLGMKRLLTQVALQRGDGDAALRLLPDGEPLMLAQAYALKHDWEQVLGLRLPERGDNAFLGCAARVRALLALGRAEQAANELEQMRRGWEEQGRGPIGYRNLCLSEARLLAEQGSFEEARKTLEGVPGLPVHLVFEVLAIAAERGGHLESALKLYAQAYVRAPEKLRPHFAEVLARHEKTPPKVQRSAGATGTVTLVVVLALAYAAQQWLDGRFDQLRVGTILLDPSYAVGAFLLNLPAPEAGAWWRFLSTGFVHLNLMHIGFNLWVLFDVGRMYEARRGWGNLVTAFAVGTFMGAYLTSLAQSGDVVALVGASGGVLGVAGALLADALRGRGGSDRALTRGLLQWMALIALISFIPGISLWAHAGGVVGGLLWGFVRQGLPVSRRFDLFIGGITIGVIVFALLEVARLGLRLF